MSIFAAAAVIVPLSQSQLPANPGFMLAFGALVLLTDGLTACLLIVQSTLRGSYRVRHLGAAYLFSALIVVPHLLAFPGVFGSTPILGGRETAIWLWCFWHGGFALGVLRFLWLPERAAAKGEKRCLVLGTALIVAALSFLAIWSSAPLPTLLEGGSFRRLNTTGVGPVILLLSSLSAILVYTRLKCRNPLSAWLFVATVAATLDVMLTLLGTDRFPLGWYSARVLSLITGVTVLFSLLSDLMREAGRVDEVNHQLERLLCTDVLTEVANRRAFNVALGAEWNRTRRLELPISLLMIDIDYFKRFNDRYGHPAGDDCLRHVAGALRAELKRPGDLAARLGGEEFALLLPMTDEAGAWHVAERVRDGVERLAIRHEASELGQVSISIGVATLRPFDGGLDSDDLVHAADRALYVAKASGRATIHRDPSQCAAIAVV